MNSVTILLAPSKTMDVLSVLPFEMSSSSPVFMSDATLIAAEIKNYKLPKISRIFDVSSKLAESVYELYKSWDSGQSGKPALWAYTGDVYKGLRANTMTSQRAEWAQQHVLIASGLYGFLRPYDLVQPYRLPMNIPIRIGRRKNLYEFWGDKLGSFISSYHGDWICNCSSEEYAKIALKGTSKLVITPIFMDHKANGLVGSVPIYSKIMRGVFARWMIDNCIENPLQLMSFEAMGYSYDTARSTPNQPVYCRAVMTPLRFETIS